MWNIVKKATNSTCNVEPPLELLAKYTDSHDALNSVNNYFVSIARNLAAKITPPVTDFPSPSSSQTNSLVLTEVDHGEVERIICGLRDDCSPGWDKIPPAIIKASRNVLIPPITHMCNLSISTGVFPRVLKRALASPIFKQGDKKEVAYYRPISVLPVLSKVMERILNNVLVKFLEKYNVIAKKQFGFRAGISTEDAVASFTSEVVDKLDSNKKCFGVFLDLSKAFDTVSISILIKKLESHGIRGRELNIFRSYLMDRGQCVRIGPYISDMQSIDYGVPQGSILGPTLFQIYVNNCSVFAYVDDTALLVYGRDWKTAKQYAQDALETVLNWLSANLLTLNLSKTQILPFYASLATSPLPADSRIVVHTCFLPSASCNCNPLKTTISVKYLGVLIDSNLK
jgi:hypothetical protein